MRFKRAIAGAAMLATATLVATTVLADHAQYYVLDGFGGVHAGGGAPVIAPSAPYFGFDIAKDIVYIPGLQGEGYLVLDGFGGVHVGGTLGNVLPVTPYFGFDVARALTYRNIPPRVASSSQTTVAVSITSSTYVSIRSVTIYAPDDGSVIAMCSATVGCGACTAGGLGSVYLATGLDSLAETATIHRQAVFSSAQYMAQSWIQTVPVTAGQHTVHCLVRDSVAHPVTTVYLNPTLTALYIDQDGAGSSAPQEEAALPVGSSPR